MRKQSYSKATILFGLYVLLATLTFFQRNAGIAAKRIAFATEREGIGRKEKITKTNMEEIEKLFEEDVKSYIPDACSGVVKSALKLAFHLGERKQIDERLEELKKN